MLSIVAKTRIHYAKLLLNSYLPGGLVISAKRSDAANLPAEKPSVSRRLEKFDVAIEKQSLSRGISLNKLEKDFLIYPEYTETEDVENIKNYVKKVTSDFENALVSAVKSESGSLPARVVQVLVKNDICKTFIHPEFGGSGFCQKDLLLLTEALSKDDLSVFVVFNQAQAAAALISLFGTQEQKEKYLPRIAAFKCHPTICVQDEQTADAEETHVFKPMGQQAKLNGLKTNVVNADIADVFIVFASQKNGDIKDKRCYIIDRNDLKEGSIDVVERINTQGLNAVHYSKVRFTDVMIADEFELGTSDSTEDVLSELALHSQTFYGAAVCGCLKKLISRLCEFANSRIDGNFRLADTHPVQTALTDLTVNVFVLESIAYYLGGMQDENLFMMNDIENTIMQRVANKTMRKAVIAMTDILGMGATNMDMEFEQMIRDITTLIATTESDLKLIRKISLPTMETFIQRRGGDMINVMKRFTITKFWTGERTFAEKFGKPKPSLFLAEHVHPSLAEAAFNLERSMARLNIVIDRLLMDKGIYIKEDYVALRDLATVMENNLGMVASIARASRSYSIGLRNADDEVKWTNYYCAIAAKETENILQEILNFFGLVKDNPKLTGIGRITLENKGYSMESPVEKNW